MLKTKQGSDPRRRHAADEALQRFAKTVLKIKRGSGPQRHASDNARWRTRLPVQQNGNGAGRTGPRTAPEVERGTHHSLQFFHV